MSDKHPKQTEVFIMSNLARKLDYNTTYEGGVKCSRTTGRPFYQVEVADSRVFKKVKSDIEVASFVNDVCKKRVGQKRKQEMSRKKDIIDSILVIIFMIALLLGCIQPPM